MVGPLVRIWKALHTDLEVTLAPTDASYLRRLVLAVDDHLIAHLLGEKLQNSGLAPQHACASPFVRIGSLVRYSVNGRSLFGRIVHGQQTAEESIGVGSRYGSALMGIHEGQRLLWPSRSGQLIEVRIDEVEHPRGARAVRAAPYPEAKSLCAFG
ncbi:hypothetical protein ACX0GZ_14445 [Sphingomonas aestuarii]